MPAFVAGERGAEMKRFVVAGLTVAIALGALGAGSIGAGAKSVTPLAPPPFSTKITCSNISGWIKTNPGVTNAPVPVGSVAAFKWRMQAVASGCTVTPTTAAGYSGFVAGAIVKASGFVNDPAAPSTCAAALGAPGTFGGTTSKVTWIATPALGATTLPPGVLGAPAEIDSTGFEIRWPITAVTQLNIGGDWPVAIPCPAGPSPSSTFTFGSPATHIPVFTAVL